MGARFFMISRVAEHCFWMFRYFERGEILTRMLFAAHLANLESKSLPAKTDVLLLDLSQEKDLFLKLYNEKVNDHELIQYFLIWQEMNPNSLLSLFRFTRHNAQLIREIISETMWRDVNGIYLSLTEEANKHLAISERHAFYSKILEDTQSIKGNFFNSLLRDDYFGMMEMGLYFERALQVFNMLNNLTCEHFLGEIKEQDSSEQLNLMILLLECFASSENFLKRENDYSLSSFVRFFMHDQLSPYSLTYCLEKCHGCFLSLSLHGQSKIAQPGILLQKLKNYISAVHPLSLVSKKEHNEKGKIHQFFYDINEALQQAYFNPPED